MVNVQLEKAMNKKYGKLGRDPKRIERVCRTLCHKWMQRPDQRLGQFLLNYIFEVEDGEHASCHMFYQEDDETEKTLTDLEV